MNIEHMSREVRNEPILRNIALDKKNMMLMSLKKMEVMGLFTCIAEPTFGLKKIDR